MDYDSNDCEEEIIKNILIFIFFYTLSFSCFPYINRNGNENVIFPGYTNIPKLGIKNNIVLILPHTYVVLPSSNIGAAASYLHKYVCTYPYMYIQRVR